MTGVLSRVKVLNEDYSIICHNAVTHTVNTSYRFKIIFYVYIDFLLLMQSNTQQYPAELHSNLFPFSVLCQFVFCLVGNSDWNFNQGNMKSPFLMRQVFSINLLCYSLLQITKETNSFNTSNLACLVRKC